MENHRIVVQRLHQSMDVNTNPTMHDKLWASGDGNRWYVFNPHKVPLTSKSGMRQTIDHMVMCHAQEMHIPIAALTWHTDRAQSPKNAQKHVRESSKYMKGLFDDENQSTEA